MFVIYLGSIRICFSQQSVTNTMPELSAKISTNDSSVINIKVTGLKDTNGVLRGLLFSDSEGFPEKQHLALMSSSLNITNKEMSVEFKGILYGDYAVSILHDANGNGKMDKNILGIPNEGNGSSNNKRSKTGPPSFEASRFKVFSSVTNLLISINY